MRGSYFPKLGAGFSFTDQMALPFGDEEAKARDASNTKEDNFNLSNPLEGIQGHLRVLRRWSKGLESRLKNPYVPLTRHAEEAFIPTFLLDPSENANPQQTAEASVGGGGIGTLSQGRNAHSAESMDTAGRKKEGGNTLRVAEIMRIPEKSLRLIGRAKKMQGATISLLTAFQKQLLVVIKEGPIRIPHADYVKVNLEVLLDAQMVSYSVDESQTILKQARQCIDLEAFAKMVPYLPEGETAALPPISLADYNIQRRGLPNLMLPEVVRVVLHLMDDEPSDSLARAVSLYEALTPNRNGITTARKWASDKLGQFAALAKRTQDAQTADCIAAISDFIESGKVTRVPLEVFLRRAVFQSFQVMLPGAFGKPHAVEFRFISGDEDLSALPLELQWTRHAYGGADAVIFAAYCQGQPMAIGIYNPCSFQTQDPSLSRFNGVQIYNASHYEKIDNQTKEVALGLMMAGYRHMQQQGLLEGKEDGCPIMWDIQSWMLAHWCLLTGIPLTNDLERNHEEGILTYGEARQIVETLQNSGSMPPRNSNGSVPDTLSTLLVPGTPAIDEGSDENGGVDTNESGTLNDDSSLGVNAGFEAGALGMLFTQHGGFPPLLCRI